MKKVVLSLAFVAIALVSCKKDGEAAGGADTTAADTATPVEAPAADTAAPAADTAAPAADTAAPATPAH